MGIDPDKMLPNSNEMLRLKMWSQVSTGGEF